MPLATASRTAFHDCLADDVRDSRSDIRSDTSRIWLIWLREDRVDDTDESAAESAAEYVEPARDPAGEDTNDPANDPADWIDPDGERNACIACQATDTIITST